MTWMPGMQMTLTVQFAGFEVTACALGQPALSGGQMLLAVAVAVSEIDGQSPSTTPTVLVTVQDWPFGRLAAQSRSAGPSLLLLSWTTTLLRSTSPSLVTLNVSVYDCGPEPIMIVVGAQSFVSVMCGLVVT